MAGDRLVWERDGLDWPHREASRFVQAGGLRWHVQRFGAARLPAVLLLHGTGSSTHSWRGLAPLLAADFSVLSCDLPGHGFTDMPPAWQLSLPGMAQAVGALLAALDSPPRLAIGHSAGAAIAARMCLDGHMAPAALISLNGAFLPLGGWAGQLFSPAAKLMAITPLVPRLFAWRAGDASVVQGLIDGTGSTLDAEGLALYGRLVRSPGHAAAALGMMAHWDLKTMLVDLPRLRPELTLVAAGNDRTIPPDHARRVQALLPSAQRVDLPGLGHLAHEERPAEVAELVLRVAREQRVARQGG